MAIRNITGSARLVLFDYNKEISGTGVFSVGGEEDYFRKSGISDYFSSCRKLSFDASKVVTTTSGNRPYNMALVPLIAY